MLPIFCPIATLTGVYKDIVVRYNKADKEPAAHLEDTNSMTISILPIVLSRAIKGSLTTICNSMRTLEVPSLQSPLYFFL